MRLSFTVPGEPIAQPRHKFRRQGAFIKPYIDADHPIHDWKLDVAAAGATALGETPMPQPRVPVTVFINCRMPRNKPNTRKRGSNPELPHAIRPDADNLAKAVLDALTGVLWKDDGQVQRLAVTKVVAAGGAEPGVDVVVEW